MAAGGRAPGCPPLDTPLHNTDIQSCLINTLELLTITYLFSTGQKTGPKPKRSKIDDEASGSGVKETTDSHAESSTDKADKDVKSKY